uniref:Ribosomal protein S15 n=1 Tax=Achlys triphylla TaxID=63345 RepID=A0A2R3ZTE5_ACHTR|nr:ribosomal protein S15 [Achlys triphylla]AVR53852.1 ribosomal protein S15 [Achlys triphylla]AWH99192.1 ribosomal protein S15 [Achlys triphylla]
MLKSSFLSAISQEENKGSAKFQKFVSPIRYEDLLHIWNCTEKIIYLREVYGKFWENVNGYWLICQKKIEYVIKN